MDETKEYDVIEGNVSTIVYQNRENGYTVLRLDSDDMGEVTVVGTIPMSTLGERLRITGCWIRHQTYGQQMQAVQQICLFVPVIQISNAEGKLCAKQNSSVHNRSNRCGSH